MQRILSQQYLDKAKTHYMTPENFNEATCAAAKTRFGEGFPNNIDAVPNFFDGLKSLIQEVINDHTVTV